MNKDDVLMHIHGLEIAMQARKALFAVIICLFSYVSIADTVDIKGYVILSRLQ
jgi:hypothetical protein